MEHIIPSRPVPLHTLQGVSKLSNADGDELYDKSTRGLNLVGASAQKAYARYGQLVSDTTLKIVEQPGSPPRTIHPVVAFEP